MVLADRLSGDLRQRIAAVPCARMAEDPCARVGGAIREAFGFLSVKLPPVQSLTIRTGAQGIVAAPEGEGHPVCTGREIPIHDIAIDFVVPGADPVHVLAEVAHACRLFGPHVVIACRGQYHHRPAGICFRHGKRCICIGEPAAVARKPDGAQQAVKRFTMCRKVGKLRPRIVQHTIRRSAIPEKASAGPRAATSCPETIGSDRAVGAEMPPCRALRWGNRQGASRLLRVEEPAMKRNPTDFDDANNLPIALEVDTRPPP